MARCPQKQCLLLCPLLFACVANPSALLQAQTQKEGYPWNFDAERRIILSLEVFQFFHVICFLRRFLRPSIDGVPHRGEMQERTREGESGRGKGGFRVRAAVHVGLGSGALDGARKRKWGLCLNGNAGRTRRSLFFGLQTGIAIRQCAYLEFRGTIAPPTYFPLLFAIGRKQCR